ncbi:DUF3800 domain-containing protein [Pseudonocardia sp. HH130630-07]|uniref:DUF3800 domain-containing protein n=1 Tax=Pseudonocardia sp. HH130630-07 TaxID=1690815 RepID=UPI000814C71D|nr:DUF3800 domain-containing protein [Pseudonocardia sp. HH130630-07]ANY06090.1 hypothetical protein AFB00_07015 [Pseudonocardia sp. HH130630-07]
MAISDVYTYIDETGDRGSGPTSSPVFGMAAVLVDDGSAAALRLAVNQLRHDFGVPGTRVMSWKTDAKNHDRRKRAAEVLGDVPGLRICYVYAIKSELHLGSYRGHPERFYNYVAYKTYESTLWAARNWKGGRARVWTRFGHVRRHDHRTTAGYITTEAAGDGRVPDHLEQGMRWVSADRYLESQAADLYGGFLKAAVWPSGQFGYTEPAYLLRVWHQIRNSGDCVIPLGLMSMPDSSLVRRNAWFPCAGCTR